MAVGVTIQANLKAEMVFLNILYYICLLDKTCVTNLKANKSHIMWKDNGKDLEREQKEKEDLESQQKYQNT